MTIMLTILLCVRKGSRANFPVFMAFGIMDLIALSIIF